MTIAVTGLNATDNPGPGVPVIRSLKERPEFHDRIVGLVYDTLEPGVYVPDLVARSYLIPYPSSGTEAVLERLKYIHAREHLDVILPTLDTEMYLFSKLAGRLRELDIRTFLPTTEQLTARAKDQLSTLCRSIGVRTPETRVLHTVDDLRRLPPDVPYPLVIKGIFYDAYKANSFDEAVAGFQAVRRKWGLPVLVQEQLVGDEYNVAALGDGNGQTLGAVAMRKTFITEKGKGWAGVTIYDPGLIDLVRAVIGKLKWSGGCEFEFIKTKAGGEYYLLEINPRFPAWIYLATAAGQNLPAAWLDLALGQPVTPFTDYAVGKLFVRCSWDLITDLDRLEKLTTLGEV